MVQRLDQELDFRALCPPCRMIEIDLVGPQRRLAREVAREPGHDMDCAVAEQGRMLQRFVDRRPERLQAHGAVECWDLPHKIGSFVFRKKGGLIAAMQTPPSP